MAKKKNINKARVDELINAYEPIYLTRTRDFNALTTVHLSENDHTNILCEILNMKVGDKKPFMESFVREVLGMDYNECDILVAKTQVKSKGNKNIGYIDLLIEEKDNPKTRIIVENKVCGAGDVHNQLARYYYTYTDVELPTEYKKIETEINEFRNEKGITPSDETNVWIVYLTDVTKVDDDTEKTPAEDSIKLTVLDTISKAGKYIHISYEEHIYDWLKNKVLPLIPYGKSGDAHNSIILYLRELENILASNTAQNQWYLETCEAFIKNIINNVQGNDEMYKALNKEYSNLKEIAKIDEYKDNSILMDLISCVLCWRNNVFGKYAPEGWTVYCVGIYVIFYPTRWLEKFGGTTYSNIHFTLTNWNGDDKKHKMNFDIDYSACRQYLMKDEKIYGSHYDQLMAQTKNIRITDQDRDLVNFKAAAEKFKKSNHYYWHIFLDPEKIATKWDPNDDEAIKKFFRNFVECDEIKKVIDYIDSAFK